VSENAMVFPYQQLMNRTILRDNIIKADKKFSKFLAKCQSGINLVILEESGVDLVDYMSGISATAQWYYLISTKNILSHDVLIMKESGPALQDEVEKDFLRVNSYLKQHLRDQEITK